MSDGKKKKVVAFSAGRRNGNTEVFLKAALMTIEHMGIDVEMIRLNECSLAPCRACAMAPCFFNGPGKCVIKDDGEWIAEKLLDSDGYLFGSPIYALTPPGIVSVFRDRILGPKTDVALWEIMGGAPPWVKGRTQRRPGALISVGGAGSEHWTSLGLPTLFTTTFSTQINVIDHMNVYHVADPGAATLRPDLIQRATELGQNLAHAVNHPEKDWEGKWLGPDKKTTCPGCHLNLMIYEPGSMIMTCAVCGRKGKIKIENDRIVSVDFPDYDIDDRLTEHGKFTHLREISTIAKNDYLPFKDQVPELMAKYKEYEACVQVPPSREKIGNKGVDADIKYMGAATMDGKGPGKPGPQ